MRGDLLQKRLEVISVGHPHSALQPLLDLVFLCFIEILAVFCLPQHLALKCDQVHLIFRAEKIFDPGASDDQLIEGIRLAIRLRDTHSEISEVNRAAGCASAHEAREKKVTIPQAKRPSL